MILLKKENRNQVLTFIPLIKDNYAEWHIINLKFQAATNDEAHEIVSKFIECYEDKKGFCYMEKNSSAMCVIRLGEVESYSSIQNDVEKKLDNKKCKVLAKKMSSNGLKNIQINLTESKNRSENKFLSLREEREENVVLIADDDMFIRRATKSLLSKFSTCYDLENGEGVLDTYKKINPDIVILDIHMPGKTGIQILEEINEIDSSAFVIISSSDAIKENVLNAMNKGAVGFLVKPLNKEKLMEYLKQCITFEMPSTESQTV